MLVVTEPPKTVEELRVVLTRILETYYVDSGAPDFEKIRLSREYSELVEKVRFLQIYDPHQLSSLPEAKAFWINLYNVLSLHGIVRFQIKLTVWERPTFYIATEYNVGGYRFSLYDIAHGILRQNRSRWRMLPPPFRNNDPRRRFVLNEFDPRIHFALHSGSRSCPPLAVYHPDRIDEELDAAAVRFINSHHFVFDHQSKTLSCSKIFKWFATDFGATKAERLAYWAEFVEDEETQRVLKEEPSAVTIRYLPYDWHLNSIS